MSLEKEVIRIYIVSDLYIIGKYRLCMTNKTTDDYVTLYRTFTCDDALTAGAAVHGRGCTCYGEPMDQ